MPAPENFADLVNLIEAIDRSNQPPSTTILRGQNISEVASYLAGQTYDS